MVSNNRATDWVATRIPLLKPVFGRFSLASAMRSFELRRILQHLADSKLAEQNGELADDIYKLLGMDRSAVAVAAGADGDAYVALGPVGHVANNLQTRGHSEIFPIERWFNSIMDRVSQ